MRALPDSSVDLIVTDQAYSGMNRNLMLGTGRIVGVYKNRGGEDGKWFDEFLDTEDNYISFLTNVVVYLKLTGILHNVRFVLSSIAWADRAAGF